MREPHAVDGPPRELTTKNTVRVQRFDPAVLFCGRMQKRGARLAVVALLLAIGGAAAVLSWDIDRRLRALDDAERDAGRRIDAMTSALVEIGLAQHGYVALGATDAPPQTTVESRLQQFEAGAAALRDRAASSDAVQLLDAVAGEMAQLRTIDARAQAYAREGQTFLASDLLFGPARQHLSAAGAHLHDLRGAEMAARSNERAVLRLELWSALGTGAALWAAGLVLLALSAGRTRRPDVVAEPATGNDVAPTPAAGAAAPRQDAQAMARTAIDLTAAAALCNDLSRVTTTAALPELLARAAGILDARGLIVWMGAGDQLFAAMAHGYEARIVSRLAPIGRDAGNATATAWRTGRLGSVNGEAGGNGAIVAPMFNPSHCIGVLAAEVRHGREKDTATRAITAIIAAQLGSVLAAWPAASSGDSPEAVRDRAAG